VRPGHFAGVATVVAKLLIQAAPDLAAFGEKDYQQLLLVRRLVRDLDLLCEILPVPTVRDRDGLALSSRNAYLGEAQLAVARRLNRIMAEIAADPALLAAGPDRLRDAGFDAVDYLVLRDAETLAEPAPGRPRRLIAAVRLGATRLLDNLPVP
jgi:pantoate--beta-alanine ligase